MGVLRRIVIWALLSTFFSSLVFLAYGWTFNETIGRRETVKAWFEQSGAYANFVDEIVSLSQIQAAQGGGAIDARILQQAANDSFTPELLQSSLESVLDGTYDWLQGDQSEVLFSVDFTEAKIAFADNLTDFASLRVQSLPTCADDRSVSSSFDPFSAPCKPPGLNFTPLAAEFRQLIIDDKTFLPDTVIEATDITIKKDEQKQTVGEVASFLPTAYSLARVLPIAAIFTALLSAVLILSIAKSKSKGVFKLFRGFAFTSLSLGLFTFFSSQSTAWVDSVLAIDPAAQGFTERIVKPLIVTATQDITMWTLRFTLVFAVFAAVILAIYIYLTKFKKKTPPTHNIEQYLRYPGTKPATLTDTERASLQALYEARVAKGSQSYDKSKTPL